MTFCNSLLINKYFFYFSLLVMTILYVIAKPFLIFCDCATPGRFVAKRTKKYTFYILVISFGLHSLISFYF